MCPCDLLLAGAMETLSPKSDDIAWKPIAHKKNCHFFLFFIRNCSAIELQNYTVLLFEQQGAQKKAGRCSILPPLCGETSKKPGKN